MKRIAFLLLAALMLTAWSAASLPAQAGDRASLVILTNSFVLPGKLDRLAAWGREAGVPVRAVNVDRMPGTPAEWLAGAGLAILDTPRPNDLAQVQDKLGDALAVAGMPWVRVGGGRPAFEGLPPDRARLLIGYYGAGGEANLRNMLAAVAAWQRGADATHVPPPVALPKTGFHHPAVPRPFAAVADYLAWGKDRWPEGAPRVAFAIHPGTLSNMQTAVVDALIASAEARGLAPLAFWFDAADPEGIQAVLGDAGPVALVNLQHMQNGPARSAEFLTLDIPVLQALGYRQDDPQGWRAAESGVPMHMVAPFLSVPEGWGMSDPLVIEAVEAGQSVPIPEQMNALLDKLAALATLRLTPPADKRLALLFWNYPAGEKNLSASHLNVPASLEALTGALADAGYTVPATGEAALIEAGQAMLGGLYRPETLESLLASGLAESFPLRRYWDWLETLPEAAWTPLLDRWGLPDGHWAVRQVGGEPHFVIPRLKLGNLLILPQPPRGGKPGHAYHDGREPPDHFYLAAYLFLREAHAAHALIHFGTHGTQEWLPGKDRGLWTGDYPFLALGEMPVFYPYIQDNIGEAIQAKRRGRAVTVSHQTPPFAPAGLYDELRDLHALIHEYEQLAEGAVRDRTEAQIREAAIAAELHRDMGWEEAAIAADFPGFFRALHDHLHALAGAALPLGLHRFGVAALPEHRLSTVMQQLGEPYYKLVSDEPEELFVEDFQALAENPAYRLLHHHLRDGARLAEIADPALREMVALAMERDRRLAETGEIEALLAGLAGRFVAPGSGGDPIRNPDVPSGRNLYAFEPDKIPTRAAYAAGGETLDMLIDGFRAENQGRAPEKLAFSLWSSEALRHLGVLESQVLHALGLQPVWDEGGRVRALEIVSAVELGRPRIDVVLQVTSVYRDQFDGFMRLLADAIDRLAQLDEPGNAVAANTRLLADRLMAQGMPGDRAWQLASLRLFGNQPGDYGSGLTERVLASTEWEEDAPLAEAFLDRLNYAFGAQEWGLRLEGENLFASQLKGTEAAVLARSSRLYGMLATDHPFEYLGGLALAVRHLDGATPALYVSDLRETQPKMTTAARFIADELRGRYLNPHWMKAMQAEGYAGTLEMLNLVNNVWGWQATAPETVRADQWQAIHDSYVMDSRDLGLREWFEQHNPSAQRQLVERLAEAIRKGYWDAADETRQQLTERWQQLAALETADATASATPLATRAFLEAMAAGYGLDLAGGGAQPDTASAEGIAEPVSGRVLEAVSAAPSPTVWDWMPWLGGFGLFSCFLGGALWQRLRPFSVA